MLVVVILKQSFLLIASLHGLIPVVHALKGVDAFTATFDVCLVEEEASDFDTVAVLAYGFRVIAVCEPNVDLRVDLVFEFAKLLRGEEPADPLGLSQLAICVLLDKVKRKFRIPLQDVLDCLIYSGFQHVAISCSAGGRGPHEVAGSRVLVPLTHQQVDNAGARIVHHSRSARPAALRGRRHSVRLLSPFVSLTQVQVFVAHATRLFARHERASTGVV